MANKDIRDLYANTSVSIIGESSDNLMTPAGSKAAITSYKASNAVVVTGTDDVKYVTPKGAKDNYLSKNTGGSIVGAVAIGSSNAPSNELEISALGGDQVVAINLKAAPTHDALLVSTTTQVYIDARTNKGIGFYTSGTGRFTIASDGAMNFNGVPTVNGSPVWYPGNFNPANYMPIGGTLTGVALGDTSVSRGDGTGVIYFGGLGSTHYLYFNGIDYVMPNGNIWAPQGNISGMSGFFTNDIYADGIVNTPRIRASTHDVYNASGAVNQKYGRWYISSGITRFEVLNDAYSTVLYSPITINHADGKIIINNLTSGSGLYVLAQGGAEGGEIVLQKPASGTSITNDIVVDVASNRFRIFENGGATRGVYIDITSTQGAAGSRIWHEGILPNPINDAPSDSSTYARRNATWVKSVGGAVMSDTAPSTPEAGQKWIRTTDMKEFVWYNDGSSSQWVEDMYSDTQRPASDGNDYVMKNGVWTLADRQVLLDVDLSGVGANYAYVFPGGFKKYLFNINRLDFSVADYLGIQVRIGGSYVTTNTYEWSMISTTASNGATVTVQNTSGGAQSSLAISSDNIIVGSGRFNSEIIFNTRTNEFDFKTMWGRSSYVGGGYNTGGAVEGIRFVGRGGQNINLLGLKIIGER